MNATKTSFQLVDGTLVEWQKNGSVPALKWVDGGGNNWKALASYQFDNNNEVYCVVVSKYLKLAGTTEWIFTEQYNIISNNNEYRVLGTGQLIKGNQRGSYDASVNLYPDTNGSGAGGEIIKGDNWVTTVAGVIGGVNVPVGTPIIAFADNPAQDPTKWGFDYVWALDNMGNIVNPMGWLGSAKYFTIGIGYNPTGAPVSINYWVYIEIADREGLIIV